ncbi:uncharacterized protein [Miscanthus floridulus]|uniref:uncharacterized protein n=1 Tax=Miscanthus floridulus TaxID=154761 RepID=UPI0034574DB0
MTPGALASSPVLSGGGGDASGPAIAHPGAEADTPEARALGKRAISLVGSSAEVEQVVAGATQLPPQRTHGAPGRKRPAEVPALAPLKALKVSPGSTAHWVVEAQAAIHHGTTSARADPKEPVAQGEAAKAAPTQAREGAPPTHEAEACGSDEAKASSVAEATEVKAPRASEAEVMEVGVPRTAEAAVAGAGAPGTTEAMVAEADVSMAKPVA